MQITSTRIPDSGNLVDDEIQFGVTESSTTPFVITTPTSSVTTPAGTIVTPSVTTDSASATSHDMFIDLDEATAGAYQVKWIYNVGSQRIVRFNNVFATWTQIYDIVTDLVNSTTLTEQSVDNALFNVALTAPGISDLPQDAIIYSYPNLIPADQMIVDLALAHLVAAYINGFTETEIPTGSLIATVKGTDQTRWSSSMRSTNPMSIEEQWLSTADSLLANTVMYGLHYAKSTQSVIEPVLNRHKTIVPDTHDRIFVINRDRFGLYGRRW